MDKPVMLSTERGHDENSFNVHYMQMQRESMESVSSLYSLSSGTLPSHFRSVSPKMEVRFALASNDSKPPARCTTRTVYIILAAIFIISSSVAVAVAVHEIRVIQQESSQLPSFMFLNSTDTETTTVSEFTTTVSTTTTSTHVPIVVDPRTHCFKKCKMYGRPEFESRCVDGFCVCKGRDYQEDTCLPSVNGCDVTKEFQSRSALIWNAATTTFRCSRRVEATAHDNSTSNVYVIGIIGNHFSESTIVNVDSDGDVIEPVILVLASHYPVRWKVKYKELQMSEIVLVSDRRLSASQVEVINQGTVSAETVPTTRNEYLPVGYGDDRYHSNTAEMLKNINNVVGPVKSFLGTNYADTVFLKLTS